MQWGETLSTLSDLLSGEAINLAYMPVLVPVGVIGNILSFLVSIDSHKYDVFEIDSVKTKRQSNEMWFKRDLRKIFSQEWAHFALSYETLFYNVNCDFTTCIGGDIYE